MVDEVLSRAPLLIGVAAAGEDEGALDRAPVEVVAGVGLVLADDREQIAEQLALLLAERLGDLVHRRGDVLAQVLGANPGVAVGIELELLPIGARGVLETALVSR